MDEHIFQIALPFLPSPLVPLPQPSLLLSFQLSQQTHVEMLDTQANFHLTHGNAIFF